MSMLKNKKLGLLAALSIVLLSLALALLLPTMAEDNLQTTYYTVTLQANYTERGTVSAKDNNGVEGTSFPLGTPVTITATAKPGYQFVKWEGTPILTNQTHTIPSLEENRTYTAVFEPLTYNIKYEGDGLEFDTEPPKIHTYGVPTKLPVTSESSAHKLVGWEIECDGKITSTRDLVNGTLGAHDYHADITLRPIFEGNLFDVTCYDMTESGKELGQVKMQYAYGTSAIPLSEWEVKEYPGYQYKSYQDLQASVIVDTKRNVVYRVYSAKSYTVTLNNNADDALGGKTSIENVTFDQDFPMISEEDYPTREGYTFIGYYYHDDKGTQIPYFYCDAETREVSRDVWNIPDDVTLYAHWNKNDYKLSFTGDWLTNVTSIEVKGEDGTVYDYTTDLIPFNTKLTITVNVADTHKLVKWNGKAITHTGKGVFEILIRNDTTIGGDVDSPSHCVTLPELSGTAFRVNYPNELFVYEGGSIPAGSYRMEWNDSVVLRFAVDSEGIITFADRTQSLSATPYLGKTVRLIRCGDGETVSDSDAQVIVLSARPASPVRNTDFSGASNSENKTIAMKFPDGVDTAIFEYACVTNVGDDRIWQSSPVFENLSDGTPYFVYIRVAATETAPHSDEVYVDKVVTLSTDFLQDCIDEIMELRQSTDGENVKKLLNDAKEEMEQMTAAEHTETYEQDMLAIVQRVKDNIGHARKQDKAIADLTAKYNELTASGAYSTTLGLPKLKEYYDGAVTKICAADTDSLVDQYYTETLALFDAVPISYLYVGEDMRLAVEKGMDKDYKLAMSRVGELTTITAQIQRAINQGTIVPGGVQMTYSDLRDALKTLDVLGYYQLRLTNKNASVVSKAEGPFEMRLLLPEDLRSDTGFLVAYYNSANEELTVLQTTREGNYLTFTAPQSVEDFVILGDHAVNMIGICIGLSVVLLTQIIAIALILARRSKAKQGTKLNAMVLPTVALTVRFFPVPVVKAVVILAVLVVILQIILTWLLMKTEIIPRRRRSKRHTRTEKPAKASEVQPDTTEENTPVEDTYDAEEAYVPVEEASEDALLYEDGYAEEPVNDGEPTEETVPAEDAEVFAAEQEWYGADDFIEPAPNPNYSLPDEDYDSYTEPADAETVEDANGYHMEFDSESNGYSLEYDNEPVEYTAEEFDGEGEGFVEYDGEDPEGEAVYEENGEDGTAYETYEELPDYGYDLDNSEDQTEVVYDYASAEDVIREEDAYGEEIYEEEVYETPSDEYDSYDEQPQDQLPND